MGLQRKIVSIIVSIFAIIFYSCGTKKNVIKTQNKTVIDSSYAVVSDNIKKIDILSLNTKVDIKADSLGVISYVEEYKDKEGNKVQVERKFTGVSSVSIGDNIESVKTEEIDTKDISSSIQKEVLEKEKQKDIFRIDSTLIIVILVIISVASLYFYLRKKLPF